MATTQYKFENLVAGPDTDKQLDMYRVGSRESVDMMQDLSAAQRAELVPYIKIWKADGGTGKKLDQDPLTNDFYQPPNFGDSISKKFGDRPPASIESMTVKTVNPRGWKTYREIDLNIVVHRPDMVFGLTEDSPNFTAVREILNFKNDLILEYGWSGPASNPVVNGSVKGTESTKDAGPAEVYKTPARLVLRMKVVTYNFQLTPNGQFRFQIHCIENGELLTRSMTIFSVPEIITKPSEEDIKKIAETTKQIGDKLATKDGKGKNPGYIDSYLEKRVSYDYYYSDGTTKRVVNIVTKTVHMKDIFNVLFAPTLSELAAKLDFKEVKLQFGLFNSKCPPVQANYSDSDKGEMANKSIGDFRIDIDIVRKMLGVQADTGKPYSIDAMMRILVGLINGQDIWLDEKITTASNDSRPKYSVPQVMVRTIYDVTDPNNKKMIYQVVDRKRYLQLKGVGDGIDEHNMQLTENKKILRKDLDNWLATNNIPRIKMYHQGSFIQNSNFSVTNDDMMKSAFLRRQIERFRSRDMVAVDNSPGMTTSNAAEANQIAMLYRSAIKGDLTVMGNFALDMLGTVWVDFGVWAYDGLFYVIERTDKVDRGGFTSTIALIAEGSDPLDVGMDPGRTLQDVPRINSNGIPGYVSEADRRAGLPGRSIH